MKPPAALEFYGTGPARSTGDVTVFPVLDRDNQPLLCGVCGAPATRWFPEGDDGAPVVTCGAHLPPDPKAAALDLPPGVLRGQFDHEIRMAVCGVKNGVPFPHRWQRRRMGGPPDAVESYEVGEFCELCGCENVSWD